jgi:hypothetical protein
MAKSNVESSIHTRVSPVGENGRAKEYTSIYRGPTITALRFRSTEPCTVHAIDFNGDIDTSSSFDYKNGETALNPMVRLVDGDIVRMWVSASTETMMWLTVIGSYDDPTLKEGPASE